MSATRHRRLASKLEKKYSTFFRVALNKQITPVLEALKNDSPEFVIASMSTLIPESSLKGLLFDLWIKTGVAFARMAFDDLVKAKNLTTKNAEDDVWLMFMQSYVQSEVAHRLVTLTASSRNVAIKAIQKAIDQSVAEGLGIAETAKLINESVQADWVNASKFRAERIARTEILGASNLGSYQGALSTGLNLIKNWLNTPHGNLRLAHSSVESVPLNQKFLVDGELMEFPGDPTASAANVINCRCTITYTVID